MSKDVMFYDEDRSAHVQMKSGGIVGECIGRRTDFVVQNQCRLFGSGKMFNAEDGIPRILPIYRLVP